MILSIIDRESSRGEYHEKGTDQSPYYKRLHFSSTGEILAILKKIPLEFEKAYQTLLNPSPGMSDIEEPQSGFGQGGLIILKATKKES